MANGEENEKNRAPTVIKTASRFVEGWDDFVFIIFFTLLVIMVYFGIYYVYDNVRLDIQVLPPAHAQVGKAPAPEAASTSTLEASAAPEAG